MELSSSFIHSILVLDKTLISMLLLVQLKRPLSFSLAPEKE